MLKLIGILIVAVGFAVRANLLVVVMAAGIATGLVSGMSFPHVLHEFGRLFVENRYIALPVILILPVVGLLEGYGLRERAEALMRRSLQRTFRPSPWPSTAWAWPCSPSAWGTHLRPFR